jgi:hypothetical protein
MIARWPEMGTQMAARKPAPSMPMILTTGRPARISYRATLLRSLLIAAILVAAFAQPLLTQH